MTILIKIIVSKQSTIKLLLIQNIFHNLKFPKNNSQYFPKISYIVKINFLCSFLLRKLDFLHNLKIIYFSRLVNSSSLGAVSLVTFADNFCNFFPIFGFSDCHSFVGINLYISWCYGCLLFSPAVDGIHTCSVEIFQGNIFCVLQLFLWVQYLYSFVLKLIDFQYGHASNYSNCPICSMCLLLTSMFIIFGFFFALIMIFPSFHYCLVL